MVLLSSVVGDSSADPAHWPLSCENLLQAVVWAWVKGKLPTGDEGRTRARGALAHKKRSLSFALFVFSSSGNPSNAILPSFIE